LVEGEGGVAMRRVGEGGGQRRNTAAAAEEAGRKKEKAVAHRGLTAHP